MVYRGWLIVFILLPVLCVYPIRFSLNFYLMSLLQGAIVAYTDYLSFRVNKNYGAETVSSIIPFSVIIVFCAWCLIHPSIVLNYLETPVKTFFIICSLCGVVYALINYRKTPLTKKAFRLLIPVLILSSTISILNKLIMSYSGENPLLCACWRVWILSLLIGIIHLKIYIKKGLPLKTLFDIQTLKKGYIFILLIAVMIFKSLAMLRAQNPAYVSCLVYLTPIWIMLLGSQIKTFNFKKQNKLTSRKHKILFLTSVIILILATR